MIQSRTGRITTVGSSGAATGSRDFRFDDPVQVLGVALKFLAPLPATTDVTLTANGRTITLLPNSGGDTFVYPAEPRVNQVGGTISGDFISPVVSGVTTISVVQADAADPALDVTLFFWYRFA